MVKPPWEPYGCRYGLLRNGHRSIPHAALHAAGHLPCSQWGLRGLFSTCKQALLSILTDSQTNF